MGTSYNTATDVVLLFHFVLVSPLDKPHTAFSLETGYFSICVRRTMAAVLYEALKETKTAAFCQSFSFPQIKQGSARPAEDEREPGGLFTLCLR